MSVSIPDLDTETHILALAFDKLQLLWERESAVAKDLIRGVVDAIAPSLDKVIDKPAPDRSGAGKRGRAAGSSAAPSDAVEARPPEVVDLDGAGVVFSEDIVSAISSIRKKVCCFGSRMSSLCALSDCRDVRCL